MPKIIDPTTDKESPAKHVPELVRYLKEPIKNFNTYRLESIAENQKMLKKELTKDVILKIEFICSRSAYHKLTYFLMVQDNNYSKIGQFPSLADMQTNDLKKYSKILSDQYIGELNRSIGLYAHGIGIGAFVYLRRIYENLLEIAHQKAMTKKDWDEESFINKRIDEKIRMLSNFLPSFLLENISIYGILSKGIHELDESECLSYFEYLKLGIELILDEKMAIIEKSNKIKIVKSKIGEIKSGLKK